MLNTEDVRHDLLLTIVVAIVILFSTGLSSPEVIPVPPGIPV